MPPLFDPGIQAIIKYYKRLYDPEHMGAPDLCYNLF